MNFLSRKTTPYLLGGMALALTLAYSLQSGDLKFQQERSQGIRQRVTEAGFDRLEALDRAQRCVVLMSQTPITDRTAAYFSSLKNGRIVIHKNRPMPDGTTVCDTFGNTGIVQWDNEGTPIVSDIKQMPSEEMTKILSQRGVMPKLSAKKVEFK